MDDTTLEAQIEILDQIIENVNQINDAFWEISELASELEDRALGEQIEHHFQQNEQDEIEVTAADAKDEYQNQLDEYFE